MTKTKTSKSLFFFWFVLISLVLAAFAWVTFGPSTDLETVTPTTLNLEYDLPEAVAVDNYIIQSEDSVSETEDTSSITEGTTSASIPEELHNSAPEEEITIDILSNPETEISS